MGAARVIEAIVGDEKIVENLAIEDGLGDDSGHILHSDPTVPDPLGIDHHRRPVFALFEAPGMVRTRERPESDSLQLDFEGFPQCLTPLGVAAPARVVELADIAADKDLVRECGHM